RPATTEAPHSLAMVRWLHWARVIRHTRRAARRVSTAIRTGGKFPRPPQIDLCEPCDGDRAPPSRRREVISADTNHRDLLRGNGRVSGRSQQMFPRREAGRRRTARPPHRPPANFAGSTEEAATYRGARRERE